MATAGRLVIEEAYEQIGWKEAFLPEIFVFIFHGTKVNATFFTFQFFYGGFLLKGPAPKKHRGRNFTRKLDTVFAGHEIEFSMSWDRSCGFVPFGCKMTGRA